MECVSIIGVEGRFLIFFFLSQCRTTLQKDKLKILKKEKMAHMDTIEFHKISSMTDE